MVIACILLLLACALALGGMATYWRARALDVEDDHELALLSARMRGRHLETAVWEIYGPDALPRLRARIESEPWGSRNRSRLYTERGFIGEAWEDGWRRATPKEKAAHEALQDRDSALVAKIDVTP